MKKTRKHRFRRLDNASHRQLEEEHGSMGMRADRSQEPEVRFLKRKWKFKQSLRQNVSCCIFFSRVLPGIP